MRSVRRTLNFTRRQKLEQQHIRAAARRDGDSGVIEILTLELDTYDLPEHSPVLLEVLTRRDGVRRMNLGTTPHPHLVQGIELHPDFFASARVRLKVLDPDGSGRILAAADDVDFDTPADAGARSLLPTQKVDDLGDRVWRLRIDSNGFLLEINRSFPRIDEVIRQPAFLALAMPDILRQIALAITDEECEVAHTVQEKWNRLFGGVYNDVNDLRAENPTEWADEVAGRLTTHSKLTGTFRGQVGDDE